MAAGKLVLLLVVGGLAGAAFAGMTTGVMRPYREANATVRPIEPRPDEPTAPYAGAPAGPSWLDEGVSLLDSPAWPFGRGSQGEEATSPYPAPDGYAPYEDDPRYDEGRWEHDDRPRRGYRTFQGYADRDYPPEYPDGPGHLERLERQQPASPRRDAASDAANRAADAAQDVIAAERGS